MGIRHSKLENNTAIVEKYVGTAYDICKLIADNLPHLLTIDTPTVIAKADEIAADAAEVAADQAQVAADLITVIANVAITNADVVSTNADVVTTNANAALTAADVISTNADVVSTNADVIATNADAVQTALDAIATAADAAQTALDVITTNADVVLTNADVVLTHADVVTTNADVVITNINAALTAADVVTTNDNVTLTNADVALTHADVITTNADVEKVKLLVNGVATNNRIIQGGVVWTGTGLTYESIDLIYELNSTQYVIADNTEITLTAADGTFDRIDTIYADDTGAIGFITGTPAETPVKPAVDETYQIELTFALVAAAATTPDGVVVRDVYLENAQQAGSEFDSATSVPAAIDLADISAPLSGATSIKTIGALSNGDTITFTHNTATVWDTFNYLRLDLKCLADWNGEYLQVNLQNNGSTIASFIINATVIDETDLVNTQTVTIFKAQFGAATDTEFNGIQFWHRVKGGQDINYLMDNIVINEDASASVPTTGMTAYNVTTNTDNFSGNLSTNDINVQSALNTLDQLLRKIALSAFLQGSYDDSEKLMTFAVVKAFTLPAGLTGSSAYADVAATANATFDIHKNGGASLGTIDFALGANTGTFTFATPTAFAVNDRLEIVNQATADATLADVSLTLQGEL